MSAKAIREYHGKKLTSRWLPSYSDEKYDLENRALLISSNSIRPEDPENFDLLASENPWLLETRLVVKPDQLIKRRGKAGLLAINKTWPEVVEWIKERMNKECKVEVVSGILDHFIVEPFVPHAQSDEYYICIQVRQAFPFKYDAVLSHRNFHHFTTSTVMIKYNAFMSFFVLELSPQRRDPLLPRGRCGCRRCGQQGRPPQPAAR